MPPTVVGQKSPSKRKRIETIDCEAHSSNQAEIAILEQLTCPVCFEVGSTYYQCEQGHTICGDCYPSVQRKCPTCRVKLPAKGIRNRVLESLLNNVNLYLAFTDSKSQTTSFVACMSLEICSEGAY